MLHKSLLFLTQSTTNTLALRLLISISLLLVLSFFGLLSTSSGEFELWASKQLYNICIFFIVMLVVAKIPSNFFLTYAYVFYGIGIILLILAEVAGHKANGAQRWLRLGPINIQPSELMKIFIILALARYFHFRHSFEIGKLPTLILPLLLLIIPAIFILKQPNLGTTLILLVVGASIFFATGVKIWKFMVVGVTSLVMLPVTWTFMHDYQKKRVLTFLNPEADPLGTGYNILQSMIAIGSGGMFGKGYMNGSQSQLNFLPEKHTDFIFTIFAEELGFFGVLAIFLLCYYLVFLCLSIGQQAKMQFSRLVIIGASTLFAIHVIINTAMISGLIPVVGTPFPFLSYGGSNLMTMLLSFGLVLSAGKVR